ncbi:MAG: sugar-binding domain-containing protein [Chloroflexota bacterium]
MSNENERIAFLAKIASLYYEQGKTETTIAEELAIPLTDISNILVEAREKGVVSVAVRPPWRTKPELEQQLKEKFNLKAVRVLVRENKSDEEMLEGLGILASQSLNDLLKPDSIIGISWGTALHHMIRAMRPASLPNAEVVQLIGAMGTENITTDGPMLAQLLANRLGSHCRYLHAPLIIEDERGRNALLQERTIRETLLRAEKVNIALVGIGSTDPELYSLLRAGYVDEKGLEKIRAAGAVGDICAQHYSASGEWIDSEINRRVIGVSLDTLSKINTVIGVAGGAKKATTILAALRGQYVNVLITDDQAAHEILTIEKNQAEAKPIEHLPPVTGALIASLKGVWKVFDGVPVLRGVNVDLKVGEIHALLGGNGSGKSTLMKILSGVYTAEAGAIELEGSPIVINGPAHAHQLGIYLVPQEPKVFPHLTVQENILLGIDSNPTEAIEYIKQLAEELGFDASLSTLAGSLSIANQQILEIIRGLLRNAKVLILDEPTSALTFREVDALFARMRKLVARGIGIFFISHRLNEIFAISDRISVLRDGNIVLNAPTKSVTSRDLLHAMLPEDGSEKPEASSSERSHKPAKLGDVVLEVKDLDGEAFHHISFNVRAGEVVGLAGLVGAGRTELAHAIIGIDQYTNGEVWINNTKTVRRSPQLCQDLGLVYVPEDRHAHGIFLDLPFPYTITASCLRQLAAPLLSFRKEKETSQHHIEQLGIRSSGFAQIARTLSGGNQQKTVLAKSLAIKPRVILLDEPTRGVDAKARQDIYDLISSLKEQGVGVLLVSSDLEEITQLSDRVLVMFHGEIVEELAHSQCQIKHITAASFGMKEEI